MAARQNSQVVEAEAPVARGRPWLYPYNRRLGHVHGISIRNLVLTSPTKSRPRGNTVDDAALPTALESPAKALAQHERNTVEHSRSSTDLRAIAESQENGSTAHSVVEKGSPSKRPASRRLRRRSTLDWQNASSQWRQQKLEDAISANMLDVFFSLHTYPSAPHLDKDDDDGDDEPIYISEIVEKTMNSDFLSFDLNQCGPAISRLSNLVVRVWARHNGAGEDQWQFLLEMALNLRSLQYIGKTIEGFPQPLPQNCILFHMKDGIYTSFLDNFTGEAPSSLPVAPPPRTMSIPQILPTSSYDALMRLGTLDECIQDALATRRKLEEEINSILDEHSEGIAIIREATYAKTTLQELNDALTLERKRLSHAKRRRDELEKQIHQRRQLIQNGYESIKVGQEDLSALSAESLLTKEKLAAITAEMQGQRRRICEDLQRIYPITPLPGNPLHFSIRNLPLANSISEDPSDSSESAESTAAALGHVALLVHNLSYYLSVPLPYPITPRASTSTILDPISEIAGGAKASRVYPLFPGRGPRFRFEFAWFLLNKDIEVLSERLRVGRIVDLRQTLPNLAYLLYVASAGEGEIPARKAGGVRGFLRGGSGYDSRRASVDSHASSVGGDGKGLMLPPQVPASKMVVKAAADGLHEQTNRNGVVIGKKVYGNLTGGKGHMRRESRLRDIDLI